MTHSKIFKRDDGSRVEVSASLYLDTVNWRTPTHYWNYGLRICPAGKRKFVNGGEATPAEILQTKMELWEMIKPQ